MSDLTLYETCSPCDGRGYRLPRVVPTDSTEPPRTEWCTLCERRGYVLTDTAEAIVRLIQRHGADEVGRLFEAAGS